MSSPLIADYLDKALALALTKPAAAAAYCDTALIVAHRVGDTESIRRAQTLLYAIGHTNQIPRARVVGGYLVSA